MRKGICLIITILAFCEIHAQVEKGYWLAGGSLSYYSDKTEFQTNNVLLATPKIGYFIIDKLAAGLNFSIEYNSTKGARGSGTARLGSLRLGPLVRYYFLPKESTVNLFSEGSVLFGKLWQNMGGVDFPTSRYIVNAGSSVFFTNSTALEFSVGYQSTTYNYKVGRDFKYTDILVAVGFHAHLRKN